MLRRSGSDSTQRVIGDLDAEREARSREGGVERLLHLVQRD
jgi:hypothetical protein